MKTTKIKIMGKVFKYTVDFFHEKGFTQLMPVMLGKSVDPLGPDPGSSIEKIPEIKYQGSDLRLVTSMILHKQVALKDFEKIFIMSPNVRLERAERKETGKHLFEFTQADFEIREAKINDIFRLVEEYYEGLTDYLKVKAKEEFQKLGMAPFVFKGPFKRYTTKELSKKYGEDWEMIASKKETQPFWALSHKREFYDKEHPETGEYLNYDLVYPMGFCEALSGAEREHEYERILMRIKRDQLSLSHYSSYLKQAKSGFMPSAGAGIGIERLVRFLTKSAHVGDVTMFTRVPGMAVEI